nr:hypothetical protein [uncultured Dysosmobacter sp.]
MNTYDFYCGGQMCGTHTASEDTFADAMIAFNEVMTTAAFIARENHGAPVEIYMNGCYLRTV